MKSLRPILLSSVVCLAAGSLAGYAQTLPASSGAVSHVLLLSIDGIHASDLANFAKAFPNSALAGLANTGVVFSNASTSKPSDSFPGLMAQITGGSPNSTGVWYDVSYDRALLAPGSMAGAAPGTMVNFDESIDKDSNAIDAGGGIDPTQLPIDPATGKPVYPHNYLRVNTIFEVAHAAGLRTAWSDKHPAYEITGGPSGMGVDDLFVPEINSDDITGSVAATEAYDDTKVQAVLNEIDGKDHTGVQTVGTPAIFGMNFQAVSVGEKLAGAGYQDHQGVMPSAGLQDALSHTDASIGKMVAELKAKGLLASTLFIVSAKHGQSPIDPAKLKHIDDSMFGTIINGVKPNLLAGIIADDGALIWLSDSSQTPAVVNALYANADALGVQKVLSGESLKLMFSDPATDSRTPDVIVIANYGVVYAGPKATKIAEHGGFAEDDVHVAMVVSNPALTPSVVKRPVTTTQIAPTILAALGLSPAALQAVQKEKTQALPGLDPILPTQLGASGDVNNDGVVDIKDAVLVLRRAVGLL